jgi:pilus assembly protein Flp/PilA
MFSAVHRFVMDEAGVTAIEYAIIAAGIAIVIIAAVNNVGTNLSGIYANIAANVR